MQGERATGAPSGCDGEHCPQLMLPNSSCLQPWPGRWRKARSLFILKGRDLSRWLMFRYLAHDCKIRSLLASPGACKQPGIRQSFHPATEATQTGPTGCRAQSAAEFSRLKAVVCKHAGLAWPQSTWLRAKVAPSLGDIFCSVQRSAKKKKRCPSVKRLPNQVQTCFAFLCSLKVPPVFTAFGYKSYQ